MNPKGSRAGARAKALEANDLDKGKSDRWEPDKREELTRPVAVVSKWRTYRKAQSPTV